MYLIGRKIVLVKPDDITQMANLRIGDRGKITKQQPFGIWAYFEKIQKEVPLNLSEYVLIYQNSFKIGQKIRIIKICGVNESHNIKLGDVAKVVGRCGSDGVTAKNPNWVGERMSFDSDEFEVI